MPSVRSTYAVATKGEGKPDYSNEVSRGKQLISATPEYGESLLWMLQICMQVPGAAIFTRAPMAIGETMLLLNAEDGTTIYNFAAGVDYVIKEFWISFDQDVEYRMIQGGSYGDVSCSAIIQGGSKPANLFQLGWTRGLLENLAVASTLEVTIENLGGAVAIGKAWAEGMYKTGVYQWV